MKPLSPSTPVDIRDGLSACSDDFRRARRRLSEPTWQAAAQSIQRRAEQIITDNQPLPDLNSDWYDANPDRPYETTYVAFHHYMAPVSRKLMPQCRLLAWCGMIFADSRYMDHACAGLLHVANHLTFHVRCHDCGMEYAGTIAGMAEVFACVRDRLTPEQQALVMDRIAVGVDAIAENTHHWLTVLKAMPYSNHLVFHRHGRLAAGLLLNRNDWITEAIDGHRGFGELLVGATYDDGLCYESSTHYHYATFGGLLSMAELIRQHPQTGRDLYHETFANGRCLKQMFDAPLGLLLPSGELPPVGDCYARRSPLGQSHADVYELGYRVYEDPQYAWLIQQQPRTGLNALLKGVDPLPQGRAPGVRTRIWPEHGYGLLTCNEADAYWQSDSIAPTAFVAFDRSGVHHHRDRGGLQVAAAGKIWLEDIEAETVASEGHAFSAHIQHEFNRTALPHNLVMVNEQNQQQADRPFRIVEFKDTPQVKTLSIADDLCPAYAHVHQTRTLAVTPDYVLDVYRIVMRDADNDTPPICDLLLHPRADASAHVGSLSFASDDSLPVAPPHAILRDVQSAPATQQPLSLTWHQGDATFATSMMVMEGEPDRLFRAMWPKQSDWATGGREMFILRARGPQVTFITLYQMQTDLPWHIASTQRYHNGRHEEIRIQTSNSQARQHHTLYVDQTP